MFCQYCKKEIDEELIYDAKKDHREENFDGYYDLPTFFVTCQSCEHISEFDIEEE